MNKRFILSLLVSLLLGIAAAAKLPVWMILTGVILLPAAIYNYRKSRIQMIVRSVLLLAFFCLGIIRFGEMDARFSVIKEIPEGEAVVIAGRIYKKEIKGDGEVFYLKNTEVYGQNGEKRYCLYPGHMIVRTGGTKESKDESMINRISGSEYPIGSRVEAKAVFRWMNQASNEGAFQEQNYYHSLGISTVLYADGMSVIEDSKYVLPESIYQFRNRMRAVYEQTLNEKDAGIMAAMVLGDKSLMEQEVKELYTDAGISHILAVSGLHISVIGMGIFRFLRKRRMGYLLSSATSGTGVLLFCILSGMSVSAVRAGIMFGIFLGANVWGRKYDSFCALAAAAIISLCCNPFLLWNAGFLFSYGAVMGAAGLGNLYCNKKSEETRSRIAGILWRIKQRVWVSTAILLVTLPLTAYFYYEIPLFSVPANLLVLPFTGILLMLGIFAGAAGVVQLPFAWILCVPCHGILRFFELVCRGFGDNLTGTWITGCPKPVWIWGYYLILIAAAYIVHGRLHSSQTGKARRYMQHAAGQKPLMGGWYLFLPSVSFLVIIFLLPAPRQFEVTFLDVGQGDGIYINSGSGVNCFVDGGSTSETEVGTYQILPFLKYHRVRSIDLWFVSHGDEDHINGFLEVLESGYPVRQLVLAEHMPRDDAWQELTSCAKEYGTKILEIGSHDCLKMGDLKITLLEAGSDSSACISGEGQQISGVSGDRNERSLIQLLEYDAHKILLTGDIGAEQEAWLIRQPEIQEIDVLKAAHHGSKYSNSQQFLSYIQPKATIISCGKGNRYGHPHEEALQRMQAVHTKILQTMESGQLTVNVRNGKIGIEEYTE